MYRRTFFFILNFIPFPGPNKMKTKIFLLFLTVLGIFDAAYLSLEHFVGTIPLCPANSPLGNFIDCGKVLTSPYATILGIPVALIGLIYYFILLYTILKMPKFLILLALLALLASSYFMSIQLFILHSICLYCSFSAIINVTVFLLVVTQFIKNINSQKPANKAAEN